MKKFRKYMLTGMTAFFLMYSVVGCAIGEKDSGNRIRVDNIHKGSGKYDRDTLYISALNVDSPQNSSIIKHDVLNVGVKSISKRSFNPYLIESKWDQYIVDSMWEPLMKIGYDGQFYPNILKQLPTVSEDRSTYLFSLKEDLLWEDGTKLTTKDIDFTFKFLMDGNYNGSFDRELLNIKNWEYYRDNSVGYVEGVEIIDDYNFKVTVENPNIYTLNLLNIYPLSYTYYGEYYYQGGADKIINTDIRPFGNGVYKFLGYAQNDYLTLESNRFYFKGKTNISNLTYKEVDDNTILTALSSGNIDIAKDIPLTQKNIIEVSKIPFLNGYIFDDYEYASIGINHSNEFLKDQSIRQVINFSLDKNEIIKTVLNGDNNVIDVPLDSTFYGLSNEDNISNRNKRAAIRILKELGFSKRSNGIYEKDGKPLEFKILVEKGCSLVEDIFPVIQKNLSDVGISLIKKEVEVNTLRDIMDIKDEYDLFLINPAYTARTNWIKSFITNSLDNYYNYSNSQLDNVLSKVATTFDYNVMKELYDEAYFILKEDLPVIPIFQNRHFDAYNGRVLGINTANMFKTFYYDEIILKK